MTKTETTHNTFYPIINTLAKIGHGDLSLYVPAGIDLSAHDPELMAHFIAWNNEKSEVRDSKVALPVIALRGVTKADTLLAQNALALLGSLDPRMFLQAVTFNKYLSKSGHPVSGGIGNAVERLGKAYIYKRRDDLGKWRSAVIAHRKSMLALYTLFHIKPTQYEQDVLFNKEYDGGSMFDTIKKLKTMPAQEAAGWIQRLNLPEQVVVGAVAKAKDPELMLARLEHMTGNQVINITASLQKCGMLNDPVIKLAYDNALARAKDDKRVSTLKASKAAQASTGKVAEKMQALQESKLDSKPTIAGSWLVLGDKSGSMYDSIELAKKVAGVVARLCEKVYLVYFDTMPKMYDVSGKSLAQIEELSAYIHANGGTSIGCGLQLIVDKKLHIDGIIICSDGGENTQPPFIGAYDNYAKTMGNQPSVYLIHVDGEPNVLERNVKYANISMTTYEFGKDVDYYSLPNVVQMFRIGRYGLLDEILQYPLATFAGVGLDGYNIL